MRVLLVDDSDDDRYLTARLLKACGYDVEEAYSLSSGRRLAVQFWPEVILCDLRVTDAYRFVLEVKVSEFIAHVPVIALTGQSRAWGDESKALEAGFDALIYKPLRVTEFRERLVHLGKGA